MTTTKWLIFLFLVNIPVFILLGWIIFNSWSNFFECLRTAEREGEDIDSSRDQLKVFIFIILCFAIFIAEAIFIK